MFSFFFKFYLIVLNELSKKVRGIEALPESHKSATKLYHRDIPKSTQLFQIVPEGQPDYDLVGKPIVHKSGIKQATGEAIYVDDMPRFEHELYLALVLSTKAHAKIVSIDPSEALKIDGIEDFLSYKV